MMVMHQQARSCAREPPAATSEEVDVGPPPKQDDTGRPDYPASSDGGSAVTLADRFSVLIRFPY
jgi:hypothetical protein